MTTPIKYFLLLLCFSIGSQLCIAQEAKDSTKTDKSAQANNPLANMTALNFHNYYIPRLTDSPDNAYLNTSWIRFAKPFANGKFLMRISMPLSTVGTPNPTTNEVNSINGLGDLNAFLAYCLVSKPTKTIGIGPLVALPTATETALGSGKWQGGFAFVAFFVHSPVLQFGSLITYQASLFGDNNRAGTSLGAIQPFYFWQLGKGVYLRGAPIWVFDFENDSYGVPMALGIGKVVTVGNTVFNLFIEPQYTMLHSGVQPQIQLFSGINMQFMGE